MKIGLSAGAAAFVLSLAGAAWAFHPTLSNRDSKTYKYEIQCGGSTTHSSISGNTTTSISAGNGNCKLKVKGAGVVKLADDMKCIIKNGELDCT